MTKKKKRILGWALALFVLVVGLLCLRVQYQSRKAAQMKAEQLRQEQDLEKSNLEKEELQEIPLEVLHLKGINKNVMTFPKQSLREIYQPQTSLMTKQLLAKEQKAREHTIENPIWAYNPYGTNRESLYLYFTTEEKSYVRYTVSVQDKRIPDFTRTLSNGALDNLTREHEYQVLGLVPGLKNTILLSLYDENDTLVESRSYSIQMPKSYTGSSIFLKTLPSAQEHMLTNGLFTVFQKGKQKQAITFYDNSGILRGEIPVRTVKARNTDIIYDNLLVFYDTKKIAKINSLGQVMGCCTIQGYDTTGTFSSDGKGNIYLLGRKGGEHQGTHLLRVTLGTGKISRSIRLSKLLHKKCFGSTLVSQKDGTILVGLAGENTVVKVDLTQKRNIRVVSILGEKRKWKTKKLRKLCLKKESKFTIKNLNGTLRLETTADMTQGQYILCNTSTAKTVHSYAWLVDETAGTVDRIKLDDMRNIIFNQKKQRYQELNQDGRKIQTWWTHRCFYGVEKRNWKGFWFY